MIPIQYPVPTECRLLFMHTLHTKDTIDTGTREDMMSYVIVQW